MNFFVSIIFFSCDKFLVILIRTMYEYFVSFCLSLIAILWWYLDYLLDYWKRKDIRFVQSDIWAALKSQFFNPVPCVDRYKKIYDALAGLSYGGCFQHFRPQLLIRNPDLIQEILLTNFEIFRDRGNTFYDKNDPITNHLFSAPATLWKRLRIRLTPAFTSDKIKYMFGLIKECAEEYQEILMQPAQSDQPFDVKDYSINYTIEVISTTAFGLKNHSMTSDSKIKEVSRRLFRTKFADRLRFMICHWCPPVARFFQLKIIDKSVADFFFKTVRETVAYRKLNQSSRNDFIQILISLNETLSKYHDDDPRKEEEFELTNELMTAQCFLFFVAGFDTSSLVLSMTLLELALNRDVQDKLQEEIDQHLKDNGNTITYEMIQQMKYLHKVVQESMRKYPVLPFISRVSTYAYQMPGSKSIIDSGTEFLVSIAGLHYDPEYFPNPEKFDPERFSDEEIAARHNFVYLPFGGGPRNCIGSRFGLISVKLGVVHLLQKYNFSATPETIYPIMKYKPYKKLSDFNHEILLKCTLR